MDKSVAGRSRRRFLTQLGLFLLALGIVAFFALRHVDLRAALSQALSMVRRVGPAPFFLAMAILPAFGFPLLAFTLSAGPVFAPSLGLPLVSFLVVVSIISNLVIVYWLSRYAFRPLLERVVLRLGWKVPTVAPDDFLSLTVLVRVTPGPPFCVQSYLLGLAGVPFKTYILVSSIIAGSYAVAVVFFGDSLVNGRGKIAVLALSCLAVLTVLGNWIRQRYQKRKLAAAS